MENKINSIICGDTLEELKKLKDNTIDLIITSPPYNTGINYDTYNDGQDYHKYLQGMALVFKECYRVLIRGGRICINCPSMIMQHTGSRVAYLSLDFLLELRKIGFSDREMICWIKSIPSKIGNEWAILPSGHSTAWGSWISASNPSIRDCSEFIIIMHKETPKLQKKGISDITKKQFISYSTNAWYMQPEVSMRRFHPAPFPIELPKRLILLYSYKNAVILDPFMGIGTTCLAAKRLGRRYIGIDISPTYCKIALDRCSEML